MLDLDLEVVNNYEVGRKRPSGWSFRDASRAHATKYTSTNAAAPIDTCAAPSRASEVAPLACACALVSPGSYGAEDCVAVTAAAGALTSVLELTSASASVEVAEADADSDAEMALFMGNFASRVWRHENPNWGVGIALTVRANMQTNAKHVMN